MTDEQGRHLKFEPPSLRARHVYLRPVAATDYPFLHMIETGTELAFRWRLRGSTPSPEHWAQTAWRDVLAQFIVVGTLHNKPLGLVVVYRPNYFDRHAFIGVTRFEPRERSPLMILAVALFLQYVFSCWDFRKLYMELPEFNFAQFSSGLGRHFELEGRLRGHYYFAGRFWDQLILAVYRETWTRLGGRLRLERGRRTPARQRPV